MLSVSMLVLGAGAILQASPRGPVGAHFLCPPVFTATYLAPSLLAARTGGLSLVLGMTAFGGLVEIALSRALRRLRPYFPSEISGVVVVMVGPGCVGPAPSSESARRARRRADSSWWPRSRWEPWCG
jgi:NCS2 family nucleobase:cation symporter-2